MRALRVGERRERDREELEQRRRAARTRPRARMVEAPYSQPMRLKKRWSTSTAASIAEERERIAESASRSSGMCSKFMPQIEARKVGDGDDRRPGRDRLHDLVLANADQRQVRLEDRGQELALGQ